MLTLLVVAMLGQTGVCKPGVACKPYSVSPSAPSAVNAYSMREGAHFCLNPTGRRIADGGTSFQCDNVLSYSRDPVTGNTVQSLVVTTDGGVTVNSTLANLGLRVNGSINVGSISQGILATIGSTGSMTLGNALAFTSGTAMTLNASNIARVPLTVVDTEGLRLQGVTTANLTPPDGGFAGTLQYDTTTNKLMLVESNNWQTVYTGTDTYRGTWTTYCLGVCGEADTASPSLLGPYYPRRGATRLASIACNWATAGSTTGNVAVQVYNVTDASQLCTCTLGACNTAAYTPLTCDCDSTMLAGKMYVMTLTSATNCNVANPSGIVCNAEVFQ